MSEYYIARVTTRGQITVPVEVRKALRAKEGDYLLFEKVGERFEVKKILATPAQEFEEFARPIRERFQKEGITEKDIHDAIRWTREGSKSR